MKIMGETFLFQEHKCDHGYLEFDNYSTNCSHHFVKFYLERADGDPIWEANVSPGSSNILPLQRSAISGFHLFRVFCQVRQFKVLLGPLTFYTLQRSAIGGFHLSQVFCQVRLFKVFISDPDGSFDGGLKWAFEKQLH